MGLDIVSYSIGKKALKRAGYVGSKDVDLQGLIDKNIIRYDSTLDKFVCVKNKTIVEQWKANYDYELGELFLFDDMMWIADKNFKSNNGTSPEIDEVNGLCHPLVSEKGFANIINLTHTILNNGASIKLDWTNPTSVSYEGREIYYSKTIDITSMRYDDIKQGILDGLDIQTLTTGLGTNQGNADTVTITPAELRKYYYVKGFVKHTNPDTLLEVPSSGRYLEIKNADKTPPSPPVILNAVVENKSVRLEWTQPSDSDFLYTKIVRSMTGIPTLPTQGTVIDTVSGAIGSYVDTTIKPSVKYHYKLFAYDDAGSDGMQTGIEGNYSSDITAQAEVEWITTYGYNIETGQRIEDAVGLNQSNFNDIYPYSDITRCVADSLGNVVYYLDENNSALQEDGITPSVLDGTGGQVVTEIPEFYYSKNINEVRISKASFLGATKFDRTYIGFAESSEDTLNNKLKSVVGEQPTKLKSLTEFRTMASNIGTGWQLVDYKTRDALKILFLIEYGGANSQTLIGNGIVSELGTKVTGGTISLGNKTGIGLDGSVSYRGIENLWGNIDEIVEGLVATDTSYYVADTNYSSFVDDANTGSYVATNVVPITSDGYISRLDISGNIIGSETIGNNIDFVGDHQYSHKNGEINIVASGGNYQDGDKAGLFRNHMGLNPFGKETEMTQIGEFDKVLTGTQTTIIDEYNVTHKGAMTVTVDLESKVGNYYEVSLPIIIGQNDIASIDKIEVI